MTEEGGKKNPLLVKKKTKVKQLESESFEQSIKNDAANAVKISRRFLTVLGVWNCEKNGKYSWRSVLSNISVIIFYFGIGIRTIPLIFYVAMDAENGTQITMLVARVVFGLMAGSKYMFLRSRRRDIEKCISHMEVDWLVNVSSARREIMLEYVRYGHLVTKIFAVFTFSAATFYAILPFMIKKKTSVLISENVTEVMSVRSFAVASHFGTTLASETPVYEFIYTSQVVATFLMHSVEVSCYSLAVVIVMHACGQLKILMEKLDDLVEPKSEEKSWNNFDNRLADIISHHVRVLRFIASAETMLREICLVDIGGGTIELCIVGYFNILEWRKEPKNIIGILAYLLLFSTFVFNIYSFCYIGELLTQEFRKVGEVTYMIDWHRLPGKQPLAICLIIAMSHNPITLTAGGAIQLSLRCFASVAKTSMGYVNMLRTVMD